MRCLRLLTLLLLTLSACTSWQVKADNRCISYGFHPGTLDYAYCMERAALANDAWWAALGQTLLEAQIQSQQNRQQRRAPTNCTSYVVGNYLNTSCY